MGRRMLYNTDEESREAAKAYKRKYYEKNKEARRDHYRLASLKHYYVKKLRNTTDDAIRNELITKINSIQDEISMCPGLCSSH